MKIIETLTSAQKNELIAGSPVGIFKSLFEVSDPWIDKAGDCCAGYYLHHSGEKIASPIFENISAIITGGQDVSEVIGRLIRSKYIEKWNRVYSALSEDYSALNDREYNEVKEGNNNDTITYNISVEDNGKTSTKEVTTRAIDTSDDIYGFNSDSPVGQSTNNENITETVAGNADDNTTHNLQSKTGTDAKVIGINETIKSHGRETAGADLIMKELELRNTENFFNIIYADIDSIATLSIY